MVISNTQKYFVRTCNLVSLTASAKNNIAEEKRSYFDFPPNNLSKLNIVVA